MSLYDQSDGADRCDNVLKSSELPVSVLALIFPKDYVDKGAKPRKFLRISANLFQIKYEFHPIIHNQTV